MKTASRIKNLLFRSKYVFESSFHFLYAVCIAPKSSNEDSKRHEFILNILLCGIIPLLLVLDGFVAAAAIREGADYQGIPFLLFTAIVLIFMYLLMLSRYGHYRLASYTFIVLFFVATTYGAVYWGVELPLVAISYIVIIIISSILISTSFAFLITSINAVTIIIITHLQIHHLLHPELTWKYMPIRINDPIELSTFFFLITGISWLSNKEMERSLIRARDSEKALLEERDLLEIKVEARTKELKEAQKDKVAQLYRFAEFGKLSSGVFHDLMNSLHVVVANMDRLEHTPEHLPEAKAYVTKAVVTSRRIGSYVAAVRKQIATNDQLSEFSVQKEIMDAIDILHFRARENSVEFMTIFDEDILLHGHAIQFYQIIVNLLGNAIDACENNIRKSLITITTRRHDTLNSFELKIQDNGCGIDREVINNIFNSFFTTKPYGKGIGLGLSHTKEIIEQAFHGSITVHSEKDIGTTFIIIIPITTHADIASANTTDL